MTLVLDLRITDERFGSITDPSINGHLHYPNDLDSPLNETTPDKIRQYRSDYNNRPSNGISFIPVIVSTSDRLHSEFVLLLFLQDHRETDRFFTKTTSLWITLIINGAPIVPISHTHPSHS